MKAVKAYACKALDHNKLMPDACKQCIPDWSVLSVCTSLAEVALLVLKLGESRTMSENSAEMWAGTSMLSLLPNTVDAAGKSVGCEH